MLLRGRVYRVMAVVVWRVVGLGLGVRLPPSPLAAGLGALGPLRPGAPVAVDGTGLLVARVHLKSKSWCEQPAG